MFCIPCRGPAEAALAVSSTDKVQKGRLLKNWGSSYHFTPAIIVEAKIYDDVIDAIKDTSRYPSPVRALGSIHSVSEIVVNQGGTVVMMRGLREVINVGKDEVGQTVTTQAGITLLELHNWLGKKELEMAVSPEIGDATVGSLVGSVSKDSGVGSPLETGTLYKAIIGVKYVDHEGNIKELTQKDHPGELALFKCSEGLLGIILEVTFRIFPQQLVKIGLDIWDTKKMVQNISQIVTKDQNAFILVQPELSFVETRALASAKAKESSHFWWSTIAAAKVPNFQHGRVLFPFPLLKLVPYRANVYRRTQVNHYAEPGPKDTCLCFSWYEYPMERFEEVVKYRVQSTDPGLRCLIQRLLTLFEEVVTGFNQLILDFAASHNGFRPGACATYFVQRTEGKPHGWFSRTGKGFEHAGLSFTLDPIYKYPADPTWLAFARHANKYAVAHGGRVSLSQTREVTRETFLAGPGQQPLKEAPNKRFTTPFLARFVEGGSDESTAAAACTDAEDVQVEIPLN